MNLMFKIKIMQQAFEEKKILSLFFAKVYVYAQKFI